MELNDNKSDGCIEGGGVVAMLGHGSRDHSTKHGPICGIRSSKWVGDLFGKRGCFTV